MSEHRVWLIRHPDSTFSRPMPEEELLKMFSSGQMKPQDEICPGNGYWFSLQDVKEMRKHFGNIPLDTLFKKVSEEVTQERMDVTRPIAVSAQMQANLKAAAAVNPAVSAETQARAQRESLREASSASVQKTSPLMKLVLAALTLAVLILLSVWFG